MERPPPRHVRRPLHSFESGALGTTAPVAPPQAAPIPKRRLIPIGPIPIRLIPMSTCTTTMHDCLERKGGPHGGSRNSVRRSHHRPVSYTHLTLPTILRV